MSGGGYKNYCLCGLVPSQKTPMSLRNSRRRRKKRGRDCRAPHAEWKPLGNIEEDGDGASEAAIPRLSANLPHSFIYKHQLPQKKWLVVKYQQKSLLHGASDNETSHRVEGWCSSPLFKPASFKPQFQTHPHTNSSPQTAGELKEEGARYKAADPLAPKGLQNEWAARCSQSARGQSQVYASTKGNIKRPHSERLLQRGHILLPYMKQIGLQLLNNSN